MDADTGKEEEDEAMPKWARALKSDILNGFDDVIDKKLAPLSKEVHQMKENIGLCSGKADRALTDARASKESVNELKAKVDERFEKLEKMIERLHISPSSKEKETSTAIVGGLSDASSAAAAKTWLTEAIQKAGILGVNEIYDTCKDRAFNGVLFVKFNSPEAREAGMERFKSSKRKFSETTLYMNQSRPFQQRVRFSFLLNLKRLLLEWEFKNVRFDDASETLEIAGTEILRIAIEGDEFKLNWLSEEWAQWGLLTENVKFKELCQIARDKLAKSAGSLDKGKGKGKAA